MNWQNGVTPINEENLNNISFEYGSNGNGKYFKYGDGTLICFGTVQKTLDITTGYQGVYFVSFGDTNFPQTFISTPIVNITVMQPNALISCNLSSKTTSRFGTYIWKNVSGEGVAVTLDYIAIGRWK